MENNEANKKDLRNKFFPLLKKLSEDDLENLLAILYADPYIILGDLDTYDKYPKQKRDKYRERYTTFTMFNQKEYDRLVNILDKKFNVYKKLQPKDAGKYTFPKVPLLIEAVEEQLELIATGQEIPKDKRITLIECFTSKVSDNDYSIVINGDYLRPLEVSKTTKTWRRFFDLLENGWLEVNDENRDLYDYLNSNDKNLIVSNTEYPRQTLIKIKNNSFVPNFKCQIATSKMLVQRQGKQRKST